MPLKVSEPIARERLDEFNKKTEKDLKDLNEIDRKDIEILATCAEYAEGVFHYLKKRENWVQVKNKLSKVQGEKNSTLREGVVEWLVKIQIKFGLKDATLHLALSILDRFLVLEKIYPSQFPLLGLVAILIAAKYEEIYPPHLRNFLLCMDKAASRKEVLNMELTVLKKLNFDISVPSVLDFLNRFRKFTNSSETAFNLAMYICEMQTLNDEMQKYSPSLLAIGGLYLAEKAINDKFFIEDSLLKKAEYSDEEIKACAKEILSNMLVKEKVLVSNIRRKYGVHRDVLKINLNSNIIN